MQDLVVVLLILLATLLTGNAGVSVFEGVITALVQSVFALVAVVGLGWLLRPLFRHVVAYESQELFVAATPLVIVASGLAIAVAGLSMALGTFFLVF